MGTPENRLFIKTLGQRIAKLRKMRGYNQFELAERCGKIVNTLSKIERGIGDPRMSTLLDIARALDVSLLDILNFDKSIFEENRPLSSSNQLSQNISKLDDNTLNLLANLVQALSKNK